MALIRAIQVDLSTMTDQTARQADDLAAQDDLSQNGNGAPDPAPQAAQPDPLAAAQREAAEYRDKLLRTLAEMENLRRRTEREVADARTYGIAGFARDVLAVADNMHRALEVIGPELREQSDAKTTSLIEGVELTERELLKTLEKNGVRKFSPQGEKFDPNLHQAMYEVPEADVPPGHVAQVVQAGYMIGERILRPALVGVSKAAPKPAQQPAGANDNPGSGSTA
jgi:molecular chaperone GrpE